MMENNSYLNNLQSDNSTNVSSNLENRFIKSQNEYKISNTSKFNQAEILFLKDVKDFSSSKSKHDPMFDGGVRDRLRKYDTMKMITTKKKDNDPNGPYSNRSNITNLLEMSNNPNYLHTTSGYEGMDSALNIETLNTQENEKQKTFKQPSQSCNVSDKPKKTKKLPENIKKRPFKRNDQIQKEKHDQSKINFNNSLKIEREVEVSIVFSRTAGSPKKKSQIILVSKESNRESNISNTNTFRESELKKANEHDDVNYKTNTLPTSESNVNNVNYVNTLNKKESIEKLSKQNNNFNATKKSLTESLHANSNYSNNKLNTLTASLNSSKRKKILDYDKSLKNPLLLVEKTGYKPIFTEESLQEDKTKINMKPLQHYPHSSKMFNIKKFKNPIPEISEEELNNNRTKLIEAYEARALKETRKQLETETSKNNEKNAKKINCLREKNLLDNILNTPKSTNENEGISENFEMEKDSEQKQQKTEEIATNSINFNNVKDKEESYDNSRITNPAEDRLRITTHQDTEVPKPKAKERVDPNEYMKKIYENIEENCEMENSFRKSFSQKLRKKDENSNTSNDRKVTYQTRLITEYDDVEVSRTKKKFPENYKEDLKYFMYEKKMQLKEQQIKEENERTEKTMKIYAGLYNINEKIKDANKKKPKYNSNVKPKKLILNEHYHGKKNSNESSKLEETIYLNEIYDFLKNNPYPKLKVKISGKGKNLQNSQIIKEKEIENGDRESIYKPDEVKVNNKVNKIESKDSKPIKKDKKQNNDDKHANNVNRQEKNEKAYKNVIDNKGKTDSNKKDTGKYATHENFISLLDSKKKQLTLRTLNSDDIESHKSDQVGKQSSKNTKEESPKLNINNVNSNLNSGNKASSAGNGNDIKKKVEEVKQRFINMINENSMNGSNYCEKKTLKENSLTEKINQDHNLEENQEVYDNNEEEFEMNDANENEENKNLVNNRLDTNQDDGQDQDEGQYEGDEEVNDQDNGEEEGISEEEFLYYNEAAKFIQNFIKVNYMRKHYPEYVNDGEEDKDGNEVINTEEEYENNDNNDNNEYDYNIQNTDGQEEEENNDDNNIRTSQNNDNNCLNNNEGMDFETGRQESQDIEEVIETGYFPTNNNDQDQDNKEESHLSPVNTNNYNDNNANNINTESNLSPVRSNNVSNANNDSPNLSRNQKVAVSNSCNPANNLEETPKEGGRESNSSSQKKSKLELKSKLSNSSNEFNKLSNRDKIKSNRDSQKSGREDLISNRERDSQKLSNRERDSQIQSNREKILSNREKPLSNRDIRDNLKNSARENERNKEYNDLKDRSINENTNENEPHRKSLSVQMSQSSYRSAKSRVVYSVIRASSSRNSSVLISPNSFDSPRLHRIHELIKK